MVFAPSSFDCYRTFLANVNQKWIFIIDISKGEKPCSFLLSPQAAESKEGEGKPPPQGGETLRGGVIS